MGLKTPLLVSQGKCLGALKQHSWFPRETKNDVLRTLDATGWGRRQHFPWCKGEIFVDQVLGNTVQKHNYSEREISLSSPSGLLGPRFGSHTSVEFLIYSDAYRCLN